MNAHEWDWPKILLNVWHAVLIIGSAYSAVNPRWTWLVPALTTLAGVSASPDISRGARPSGGK